MKTLIQKLLPASLFAAIVLSSGCSTPVLDFRNAELPDGMIYAKDANKPFSGNVTHVPNTFIFHSAGYNKFMQMIGGDQYTTAVFLRTLNGDSDPDFYCDVHVSKGYVDGDAICTLPRSDSVIIKASFKQGTLSGKFTLYNPKQTDKPLGDIVFKNDVADGVSHIYSPANGNLIQKANWSNGLRDGDFEKYDAESGDHVLTGKFENDNLTGTWTQYDNKTGHPIAIEHYQQGLLNGTRERFDPSSGKRILLVDKFENGTANGTVKMWDANGKLLSEDEYANGQKVAKPLPAQTPAQDSLTEALTGESAGPTPAAADSVDTCVQKWSEANHREAAKAGVDDVATADQIGEWTEWCKNGKQAPAE